MSVHQSPRRHSGRFQNTYEDGTDENEQHLLQPADRLDRPWSTLGGSRSSLQDQHPRHIQLHASTRLFADPQHAAYDVLSGPHPNAPLLANSATERIPGKVQAEPANSAADAALPPPQERPFSSVLRHRMYWSPLDLPAQLAHEKAAIRGPGASSAAVPFTHAAGRSEHLQPPHRTRTTFNCGGGRGLCSTTSEPINAVADLEQKSAFYRNANYAHTASAKPPPLVLPELPIPKFDGDIRFYPVFRNRFLETVGCRSDLEPRHKFQYLLGCLKGEPLHLANAYLMTDTNYFKLLDRLEDRYGDNATLVTLLAQEFVNLKPVGKDARDLRRFHDEALRLADELEQLGEDLDGNVLWRHALFSKMPQPLLIKISENLGKDPMTAPVQEILTRLSDHLRILEKAEISFSWNAVISPAADDTHRSVAVDTTDLFGQPCRQVPEPPPVESLASVHSQAPPVATNTADEQLQERRTCPLCGLLHSAADCTVYDTTNRRLRRALKLNLCLLCLREGHPAVSCPQRTTRPCIICHRGQHNRALCKDADDDSRRRDARPSRIRANRDLRSSPEASDQQRNSRNSAPAKACGRIAEQPVIREATCCMATATPLRQSGTQSSRERFSGNLMNRKKRTKDLGTDPPGQTGTNRPPTTSTDESIKQKEADAYGRDRRLPGRDNLLLTYKCLTNREMMKFDRSQGGGSDGVPDGMPDEKESRELFTDEDSSHQPSDGHRTDAVSEHWSPDAPDETRFPPNEESTAYVACASVSDGQPAVLHECLAVTAVNPVSKKSCRAVIMFDSGTTYSHVSAKLARLLDLPHGEMRVQNVSTFGSETPLFIRGFRTFLVLCSEHGRSLQLNVTVLDHIVSSVRTALVRDANLPSLRRDDCTPNSTREMPDLLIGQDLVHLFDYEHEPTLPSGYYIVRTSLGPAFGGARRSVTQPLKARTIFGTPAAHSAAEDVVVAQDSSRWTIEPPPSQMELTFPHHHRPMLACPSANSAADIAVAVPGTNECLETSTPTLYSSGQPSHLSRASGALPRSTQKQLFQHPPDTKPLFLPTYSFAHVDVEEVSPANSAAELLRLQVEEARSANSAAGLPRPIQEPFSFGLHIRQLPTSSTDYSTRSDAVYSSTTQADPHPVHHLDPVPSSATDYPGHESLRCGSSLQ